MEIGDGAGGIRLDGGQQPADRLQQRQRGDDADEAGDEVADRQAAVGGVVAGRSLEDGVDGRAEVGAEHQREGGLRRHGAVGGERHGEQHDGNARMRRPGGDGADEQVDQRNGRYGGEHQPQSGGVLELRHELQQLVQRREHQAEADEHAAEIVRPARRLAPEHQDAHQDERRRDGADVERQHLDDQRGADVGAEHHRQRRHQRDQAVGAEAGHHQAGRRAALQGGGNAEAGQKGATAMAQRLAEDGAQVGAEGALHPRLP